MQDYNVISMRISQLISTLVINNLPVVEVSKCIESSMKINKDIADKSFINRSTVPQIDSPYQGIIDWAEKQTERIMED
jgi:hypothetical protein